MKVLITGAKGILGKVLTEKLNPKWKLLSTDRSLMNIVDRESVFSTVDTFEPDIIIHSAAMTNVEQCEINPDVCMSINVHGTQNLIDSVQSRDVLFIYISSTGIYGSLKDSPYDEFDEVAPQTIHHRTKTIAENLVSRHCQRHLIVRTGWLFGGDSTNPKNFIINRYREALKLTTLLSDKEQNGSPTFVDDLVRQISVLVDNRYQGVFNCVNEGFCSRYEYIKEIIKLLNIKCKVQPVDHSYFNRKANVSLNETAKNAKLDLYNLNVMGPWRDALKCYISSINIEEIKKY